MTLDSTDYDPRPAEDFLAHLDVSEPLSDTDLDRLFCFPDPRLNPCMTHCDQVGIPFAAFPHAI